MTESFSDPEQPKEFSISERIEQYLERRKALDMAEERLQHVTDPEDRRIAELNIAAMRMVVREFEDETGFDGYQT